MQKQRAARTFRPLACLSRMSSAWAVGSLALAVFIAIGTMISLAYYLRVVAAKWRGQEEERPGGVPAIAGASPEADPVDPEAGRRWYLVGPAVVCAAATVFFGVIPQPLVDWASHAGASLF